MCKSRTNTSLWCSLFNASSLCFLRPRWHDVRLKGLGVMGQKSSKQPQVDPRHLAPQKLHCFNEVDLRKLKRLIKDRKLAPCCPGVDSESREVILGCTCLRGVASKRSQFCGIHPFPLQLEECPICFLKYPSLNRAVCCHKPICTECFLQVHALTRWHPQPIFLVCLPNSLDRSCAGQSAQGRPLSYVSIL